MDTMEQMLSMLLNGAVETLDIAPHLQQTAVERYQEVGTWLADHEDTQSEIYPQGSFRLGTVVRPHGGAGEYDIDLVIRLLIAKSSTSQADLKARVGQQLQAYLRWKARQGHTDGPKACEARRRCWTLSYPDHGFHLDVLPAIPDADHQPTGILLTDKRLREWQHSNPIGYARWFRTRSEELRMQLKALALSRNVAEVPDWEVRTTLQRLVQVLKWHTMLHFADDPDNRPPSILITTLAGRAYRGEPELFTAVQHVLAGMLSHVENRDGTLWVPNPAHASENFADKWDEYPERRDAFLDWHRTFTADLAAISHLEGKGLHVVAARMAKSFDPEVIELSARHYGEHLQEVRKSGTMRMTGAGTLTTTGTGPTVRRHSFYGQPASARD